MTGKRDRRHRSVPILLEAQSAALRGASKHVVHTIDVVVGIEDRHRWPQAILVSDNGGGHLAGLEGSCGSGGIFQSKGRDRRLGSSRRERCVTDGWQLVLQPIGELAGMEADLLQAEPLQISLRHAGRQ